jgi:hypothetical protein
MKEFLLTTYLCVLIATLFCDHRFNQRHEVYCPSLFACSKRKLLNGTLDTFQSLQMFEQLCNNKKKKHLIVNRKHPDALIMNGVNKRKNKRHSKIREYYRYLSYATLADEYF